MSCGVCTPHLIYFCINMFRLWQFTIQDYSKQFSHLNLFNFHIIHYKINVWVLGFICPKYNVFCFEIFGTNLFLATHSETDCSSLLSVAVLSVVIVADVYSVESRGRPIKIFQRRYRYRLLEDQKKPKPINQTVFIYLFVIMTITTILTEHLF